MVIVCVVVEVCGVVVYPRGVELAEDHLVCLDLVAILTGHGHIKVVLLAPKLTRHGANQPEICVCGCAGAGAAAARCCGACACGG